MGGFDPKDIAAAYLAVARVDHYLVTVRDDGFTWDELKAAEQILINADNAENNTDPALNLALDLIERAIQGKLR